ncbi:unnamed protein product [Ectocarpus sp. CCAP 1310/34]|nr:unnamed protein product [Ectocarpus sp. CCAP 1310/34]
MPRSQALAPCVALLLGRAVVMDGFLPAPRLIPARHNAVSRHHHSASSLQEHPHRQTRTRSTADHDDRFAKTTTATLSMARSSPGGNASGARGWMAILLCAAALFSGPDVVQMEAQQGLPSLLRPPLASALSEEQDVVNDVWRVVNAAYVDPTFNGQDWKAVRLKVLKQVQDRRGKEEAYAAAKGMLKGLGDPYTRFLTPQEYDAVTGLARGGVAGVGLELASSPASSGNPLSVIVAGVVDGSPAAKAGVLTGDVLSAVDGEEVCAGYS